MFSHNFDIIMIKNIELFIPRTYSDDNRQKSEG